MGVLSLGSLAFTGKPPPPVPAKTPHAASPGGEDKDTKAGAQQSSEGCFCKVISLVFDCFPSFFHLLLDEGIHQPARSILRPNSLVVQVHCCCAPS